MECLAAERKSQTVASPAAVHLYLQLCARFDTTAQCGAIVGRSQHFKGIQEVRYQSNPLSSFSTFLSVSTSVFEYESNQSDTPTKPSLHFFV